MLKERARANGESLSNRESSPTTYNRSEIMKRAWTIAKGKREYHTRQDWTPGIAYGRSRPATAAEKREVFAEALRTAWRGAKFRMKAKRRSEQFRSNPAVQRLAAQIDMLENQSFHISTRTRRAELEAQINAELARAA